MHHIIQADRETAYDERIDRYVGLQSSRGTDANNVERAELLPGLPGCKVNIDQGVQLIEYNVNIVRPDTRADNGEALVANPTGMCNEFPLLDLDVDAVEMTRYARYSPRVTDGNYYRGYLAGM